MQAPLTPVRRDDKTLDVEAMLAQVPGMATAGVTNVYVNAATLGRDPAESAGKLPAIVSGLQEVLR